jgi:hypothetical protein
MEQTDNAEYHSDSNHDRSDQANGLSFTERVGSLRRRVSQRWTQIRRAASLDRINDTPKNKEPNQEQNSETINEGATSFIEGENCSLKYEGTKEAGALAGGISLKQGRSLDKEGGSLDKEGGASFKVGGNWNKGEGTVNKEGVGRKGEGQGMRRTSSFRNIMSALTSSRTRNKSGAEESGGGLSNRKFKAQSCTGRTSSSNSMSSDLLTYSRPIDNPTHFRPIARILSYCNDGTLTVELTRPPHGPFGFYIERGKDDLHNCVFVSRLSDGLPEKFFSGLLSVGDEILEINGITVKSTQLDFIYDLLADSQQRQLVLRILPLTTRTSVDV